MRHPTIKQLDFVIKKLKSVLPQASKKDAFNMSIGLVYSDGIDNGIVHHCGTVHCTSGWYVFANLRRKFIKDKYDTGYIDYEAGADLMARDLGFKNSKELRNWARNNPDIWDNKNGDNLFLDAKASAYNSPGYDGVVKQFEIVRSNLMKLKGSLA